MADHRENFHLLQQHRGLYHLRTDRANAYRILEDSLNLRDVRIYDTIEDAEGRERRVLNAKETTLAAQKQQAIREAFKDWIWKDPNGGRRWCASTTRK